MKLTAKEISEAVQGTLKGDAAVQISDAAGLDEATADDISFFHNAKYLHSLEKTRAGIVLVPPDSAELRFPKNKTLIHVKNPQWAFAVVLGLLERARMKHPQGVSAKAEIASSAQIGAGVSIGAFAVIEANAKIAAGAIIYSGCYVGANCEIGEKSILYPHVVLRNDSRVGARVIVHPGVVIGADGYGFATVDGHHSKIPQIGRVVVEDDVEIGANVTIDRATTGETRIGAGTKIDNLVHIAHNVHIGRDCLIVAQVGISGSTKIGNRVTLAGQVGITGHLTIGDGAVIAAQSGIMNDVEPGAVLFGSPARPHREAMKLQALLGRLPEIYDAFKNLRKKIPIMNG